MENQHDHEDLEWDQSLIELAEVLGIKRENFQIEAPKVKTLDSFQTSHLGCATLTYLPNLQSASLIEAAKLQRISFPGHGCRMLTHLLLIECDLDCMEGLSHLINLKSLVLDSNKITKITGLESCVGLEKLWINDNHLTTLSGLSTLTQLKELSVARNRIETISDTLDANVSLKIFNIAHNRIGHFRTILPLRRLSKLRHLCLSDPHWGMNPVCNLCNYQTYVLCQLPQLDIFDTIPLTAEMKTIAEATYMKKRMYYNMRIKTLKRNTTDVIRHAQRALAAHIDAIEAFGFKQAISLAAARKNIEEYIEATMISREGYAWCDTAHMTNEAITTLSAIESQLIQFVLDHQGAMEKLNETLDDTNVIAENHKTNESDNQTSMLSAISKIDMSTTLNLFMSAVPPEEFKRIHQDVLQATSVIIQLQKESAVLRSFFEIFRERLIHLSSCHKSRMLVELGTGGNIRFEEGKPSDLWYASCIDLLRSRFYKRDFSSLGLTGLRIHRVTRIHNRLLRTKFESRMTELLRSDPSLADDSSTNSAKPSSTIEEKSQSSGHKRPLEYLFYSPEWNRQNALRYPEQVLQELQKIAEDGFKSKHATVRVPVAPLMPDINYAIVKPPTFAPRDRRFHKQRSLAETEKVQKATESIAAWNAITDSMQENNDTLDTKSESTQVWAHGIPFTNSLACLDLPRLHESVSTVLKRHDGYIQSKNTLNTADESNSSHISRRCDISTAGPSTTKQSDSNIQYTHGDGFSSGPQGWSNNAGLNLDDSMTKTILTKAKQTLVSYHSNDERLVLEEKDTMTQSKHKDISQHLFDTCVPIDDPSITDGALLICKVYVARDVTISQAVELFHDYAQILNNQSNSTCNEETQISNMNQLPEQVHTVIQPRHDDPKQRQWVSLDPVLVLPEYIVEYEYKWTSSEHTTNSDIHEPSKQSNVSHEDEPLMDTSEHNVASNKDGVASIHEELQRVVESGLSLPSSHSDMHHRLSSPQDNGKFQEESESRSGLRSSIIGLGDADMRPLSRALGYFSTQLSHSKLRLLWSGCLFDLGSLLPQSPVSVQTQHRDWTDILQHSLTRLERNGVNFQCLPDMSMDSMSHILTYVNLSNSGLRSLEMSSRTLGSYIPNVRTLILSFNKIVEIPQGAFIPCRFLRRLELSYNSIRSIETNVFYCSDTTDGTYSLQTLLLDHNNLEGWNQLGDILCMTDTLLHLDLRGNPFNELQDCLPFAVKEMYQLISSNTVTDICKQLVQSNHDISMLNMPLALSLKEAFMFGASHSLHTSYRASAIRTFEHLKSLDKIKITSNGRHDALQATTYITPELVRSKALDVNNDLVFTSLNGPEQIKDEVDHEVQASEDTKWSRIRILDVSRAQLQSLAQIPPLMSLYTNRTSKNDTIVDIPLSDRATQTLQKLSTVRKLDASCNDIRDIRGIEYLTSLETLSLEDNQLDTLSGLGNLTCLSSLELGKNKLTNHVLVQPSCGLFNLQSLTLLSLEDNSLTDLTPFAQLSNLMELYLCNNQITKVKQILQLKPLSRLIILDLAGNPMTRKKKYRLYTVYHLKRVKVLDGIGIDAKESESAKYEYSGRINIDMLEERFGQETFVSMNELDLCDSRLRGGDLLEPLAFRCLAVLHIDRNFLIGDAIRGLRLLPHLSVLTASYNKIDNLESALNTSLNVQEQYANERWENFCNSNVNKGPTALKQTIKPTRGPKHTYFAQLEVLNLEGNQIRLIEQLYLSRLPALKVLVLTNNEITKICGFRGCHSLRELRLDKNKIRHIDPESFAGVEQLCSLHLNENSLKSLANLEVMTTLQTLNLASNRVSEFTEIDRLTALPYMTDLSLNSNPIARKQLYRLSVVKRLDLLKKLDNVAVSEEEKQRGEAMYMQEHRASVSYYVPSRSGGPSSIEHHEPGAVSGMADRLPMRLPSTEVGMPQDYTSQNQAYELPTGLAINAIELTGVGLGPNSNSAMHGGQSGFIGQDLRRRGNLYSIGNSSRRREGIQGSHANNWRRSGH